MNRFKIAALLAGVAFVLCAALPAPCRAQADFRRGDANVDGVVDLSDAVFIIHYIYRGTPVPTCMDAADATTNNIIDLGDPLEILNYLYIGFPHLLLPGPDPGPDLTPPPDCPQYDTAHPPLKGSFSFGFECPPEVTGEPGEVKTIEVFTSLTSGDLQTPRGAEGWALGIHLENARAAAIDREPVADDAFYERTKLVDPGLDTGEGPQGEGAFQVVALTTPLDPDRSLPLSGTIRTARLTLEVTMPPEGSATVRLAYRDGKVSRPGTLPIKNLVTLDDATHIPELGSCEVVLRSLDPGGLQLPGDCNQDGALDISDAICLLGHLFLGTPSTVPCEGGTVLDPGNVALLDSNGDGMVDLSDGVRVLGYLFGGSGPPVLGAECVPIAGCPDNSAECNP